jgi:rootletin
VHKGKRDVEGRLTSAQTALMLQEEAIRRSDRDRKQQAEKINTLERTVAALESEKRQLQV